MSDWTERTLADLHPRSVDARLAEAQAKQHDHEGTPSREVCAPCYDAQVPATLYQYYGMKDRPKMVGAFLFITNEDMRVIAEIVGQEAREARDCEDGDLLQNFVASRLEWLVEHLLAKAAEMDKEAAS